MVGQTISHYKILEKLGEGGMGVVYKARDLKLDRIVALNFLPHRLTRDKRSIQSLMREAKATAALNHPNIATIHAIEEADGEEFIVMEFVEGNELKKRLTGNPIPTDEALAIASQVVEGLRAAHAKGIIHRDIKSTNIMVTESGQVKIMDFGLAKVRGSEQVTNETHTVGTVAYMSPEQARGDELDLRTDIWSFGVVLYEMLSGRLPFWSEYEQALVFSILNEPPASLSILSPSVPAPLESIVNKTLAKNRTQRYQSTTDLLNDLNAFQGKTSPLMHGRLPSGTQVKHALHRTWAIGSIASFLILALAWAVWQYQRQPSNTTRQESHTTIAVLPFSYRGNEEFTYLGDGIVDLISSKIDGAGGIRSIDPRAVLGLVSQGTHMLDPKEARSIAERLGADRYLLGTIVEIGGRLQMSTSMYDVKGTLDPVTQEAAAGEVSQAFNIVDTLALQLLTKLDVGQWQRPTGAIPATTSSLLAFKSYLDGEISFRRGDFRSSADAFQRAVTLDTAFALAYYRLSIALEWLGTPQELHKDAADKAFRHAGRLTNRLQQLLEALRVWRSGANQEALAMYRSIVNEYPDEIEAWYQLGEVLFHRNPFYGASFGDSREAFERVLLYQPDHYPSMIHLARIAASQKRLDAMDALINKYQEQSSARALESRALQAFAHEDGKQEEEVLNLLEHAQGTSLALTFLEVSLFAQNLQGTERIARMMTAQSRPPNVRAFGYVALAHVDVVHGKWEAAKRELEKLGSIDPWAALEYRAIFSALPFLNIRRAELAGIRDDLDRLTLASRHKADEPAVFLDVHDDLHLLLRGYLKGLLSARMGDVQRAEREAEEVKEQVFPPDYLPLAEDLSLGIRAQIDRVQGRNADALAKLEQTLRQTKNPLESPFISLAYERFTRAQLLLELGRHREALSWFEHLVEASVFDFLYLPMSHLWQGEIYRQLGESTKAADHYASFIELWKDCDPELRPMVDIAKQRLREDNGAASRAQEARKDP